MSSSTTCDLLVVRRSTKCQSNSPLRKSAFRDGKLRLELVRRTRFTLRKAGNGYEFEVVEQELFGGERKPDDAGSNKAKPADGAEN